MIKISRVGAYQYMDQVDFDLMDHTHAKLAADDAGKGRELSSQFFVQGDKTLRLEFYFDSVLIEFIKFPIVIPLTADGEKRLVESLKVNIGDEDKTNEKNTRLQSAFHDAGPRMNFGEALGWTNRLKDVREIKSPTLQRRRMRNLKKDFMKTYGSDEVISQSKDTALISMYSTIQSDFFRQV